MEIRKLGPDDQEAVAAAGDLFDDAPDSGATRRFLNEPTHHIFVAYDTEGRPVGFVTGVELTHPDKGTEMLLYELSVHPAARRHGVGLALVEALYDLSRQRGCYGMWTGTEDDNEAALGTYRKAGGRPEPPHTLLNWPIRSASSG